MLGQIFMKDAGFKQALQEQRRAGSVGWLERLELWMTASFAAKPHKIAFQPGSARMV